MAVCHSEEGGWTEVTDLDRVSELKAEAGNLLWAEADVADLTREDIETIAQEFGLHPLAVEDAVNTRQRPKFESYDTHLFLVFHQLDEHEGQLEAVQIACFVGPRYVLTIHANADRVISEAKRRWSTLDVEVNHPSFLIHVLLDVTVDEYQEIADRLDDEVEQLEEIALESPNARIQRQLYSLKQRLSRLRRYAIPATRLLDWVVDPDTAKPFSDKTAALFRDVHDHLLRITDQVRNIDDLVNAVLSLQQSEQATSLNDATKRLSGWAAIIAVPTFIASVYGMNFELIPNEQDLFGFWFAVVLMVAAGIGLYSFFRRRGWL